MILKKMIKFASFVLVFFGISALESCKDDEKDLCYKCTIDGDSQTLCYEDYKDDYTKEEFKEIIALIETYLGDVCDKK